MVNRTKLAANIPLFYVYSFLNSFILDRAIWMLFLVSQGFSLTEIALIESAYHCTIFLLEVPAGYVADRYGKRVSLLMAEVAGIMSSVLLGMRRSSWPGLCWAVWSARSGRERRAP